MPFNYTEFFGDATKEERLVLFKYKCRYSLPQQLEWIIRDDRRKLITARREYAAILRQQRALFGF